MPRRQSLTVWMKTREQVHNRDLGRCQGPYCADKPPWSLPLDEAQIDHIKSGLSASNDLNNLRTLCRRCHALRADSNHRRMIASALREGIIPPNWRPLAWDDD